MKDRSRKNRVSFAVDQNVVEMFKFARAARSNDGHVDRLGNRPRQRDVVAARRAVRVHAR